MSSNLIYLTGGIRGGQRRYAFHKGEKAAGSLIYLLACSDDSQSVLFNRRKSYAENDKSDWLIHNESLNLSYQIEEGELSKKTDSFLVIDDLSIWVHNLIYGQQVLNESDMKERCKKLVQVIKARKGDTCIITEETGMGVTPEINYNPYFKDILGVCNKTIAENSDESYLMVSGQPMKFEAIQFS